MTARVMVSIGTRPEAIKLAPVIETLEAEAWAEVIVLATAQHRELLDQCFAFFGIDSDVDLGLMRDNQTLADLTARMVTAVDQTLGEHRPDVVLAQGDTTTVMVTALACYYRGIPFGHVEAGLRTGDKLNPFPEEMNRALVGRLADFHFAPTDGSRDNLLRENVPESAVFVTGNTVIDALQWTAARVEPSEYTPVGDRRLILVTAHRRENFGEPLAEICSGLARLADRGDVDIVYPVHPNPNVRRVVQERLGDRRGVRLIEPLDHPRFVAAMKAAHLIISDSGGVQEEAPSLGVPVLVLRDETERPEGVAAGAARLVGPHADAIEREGNRLLDDAAEHAKMAAVTNPYGDGKAAERIVAILKDRFSP